MSVEIVGEAIAVQVSRRCNGSTDARANGVGMGPDQLRIRTGIEVHGSESSREPERQTWLDNKVIRNSIAIGITDEADLGAIVGGSA